MSTWQIWANISTGKGGDPWVSTTSLFKKGQLMGDGVTTMEDFERKFAEEEGDRFVLLKEFTLTDWWFAEPRPDVNGDLIEPELMVAREIYEMFGVGLHFDPEDP